ncbi:class I SAM-dependent methyltransferase [Goekera deserti]|uniref:Class I SAM-dependent methyltransferase n=1 Tax=Goekera deserti TaxID=2497753 RepID=A0A7K3W9P7_9ACTN|nr:class I SAM-dependent methyltransferase [Goekera deserti]NDI49632.1 methyltransferase domain-containing protein [Goekera deserti]NEL53175.1 class I SAM-dependent methyltransferase [Goekera deserti]
MGGLGDLDGRRARVFGGFAEEYDRRRPGYPAAAVDWLLPPGAADVVDVGAGTGKLTGALLERGLQVTAVEPDPGMLAVLGRRHPAARALLAGADALPLPAQSVDAVLVAQAWHWFPHEAAVAEVRRVLRPGGWLGLVWNAARPVEPWEHRLARLDPDDDPDEGDVVPETPEVPGLPAGELEHRSFPWTWEVTAAEVRAREATYSAYAVMSPERREQLLDAHAAVVAAEASRRGTTMVPLGQQALCVRWRP